MADKAKYVGANIPADLYDWIEGLRAAEGRGRSNQIVRLLYEAKAAREAMPGLSTEPGAINWLKDGQIVHNKAGNK